MEVFTEIQAIFITCGYVSADVLPLKSFVLCCMIYICFWLHFLLLWGIYVL